MHGRNDPRLERSMTVELVWRRLCGARDESPSSNMGRVKQEEALRADVMKPRRQRVMARRPRLADATQNECARALPRSLGRQEQILSRGGIEDAPKLTTLSESEQYLTTSSSHGSIGSVKIELNSSPGGAG